MLELRNIKKEYVTGAESVMALKGVNLAFRKNEFVSILGQSGCGKTTLLNIMGGLDQYTSGDLIINGVSTKQYKDADWDAYRNHSIGFVFQSYNLIPHQTVLANVELALTLSGVSAEERTARAKAALQEVGLGDQMNKKPAQMSGGQMQRVAIARALINNPDILLADEPTGALDSETSVQIMNIIKKIAQDRLVIMVTHNPDLAREYSTRIVSLSDGLVTADSDPYDPAADEAANQNSQAPLDGAGKVKNKSMSMKTALQLSLNNLMTKKARTLLTSFAGSIGIIGIALILSVSNGFQNYIDKMETDTLTSYPLTIESETADMTSMLAAFADNEKKDDEKDSNKVKEKQIFSQMFASVGTNDLKTFNRYVKDGAKGELKGCFDNIQYSYGIKPQVYSTSFKYGVTQVSPGSIMSSYQSSMQQMASSFSNNDIFFELIDNRKMCEDSYEVLAGKWPEKYNECVLVLPAKDHMNDYMAYCLGLRDPDEMKDMISDLMQGEEVEIKNKPLEWTYDELMELEFALVNASDRYKKSSRVNMWEDMSGDKAFMKDLIRRSEKLKITAVACPDTENSAGGGSFGVGYLPALTTHVIEEAAESDIVKSQKAQKKVDVFSGKTFDELNDKDANTGVGFGDMISIDQNKLAKSLGGNISPDKIKKAIINGSKEGLANVDPTPYITTVNKSIAKKIKVINENLLSKYKKDGITYITSDDIKKEIATNQDTSAHSAFVNKMLAAYGTALQSVAKKYEEMGIGGIIDIPADPTDPDSKPVPASDVIEQAATGFTESIATGVTAYGEGIALQKTAQNVPGAMAKLAATMGGMFNVDPAGIASAFSFNMDEDEITRLIQSSMGQGIDANYDNNLRTLGYADFENPYAISYYLSSFDAKEKFLKFIDNYNDDMEKAGDDDKVISYTDITGVLLKSVKKITNSVSYVLIAFVAISLIVSSIMIGVITYISVLERTKEIGILRAIGASKKDISRIFNAETIIIGLCAGLIGILMTLILLIPINIVLIKVTDIAALKAILPAAGAVILILISIFLTFIAGLIPSGMASRKDPVVALRTE